MNKKIILVIIILFSQCVKENSNDTNEFINGTTSRHSIVHDGLNREYLIYIPSNYNQSEELPLLFNFHGFGGSVSYYMSYVDMRPLAESNNFILVYPQGSLLGGYPHWNAGLDNNENKSSVDDYGFVEELINYISSNLSINQNRIYSCGFSNGSFFSYSLGCYLENKIAAVGSVGGTMLSETYDNCDINTPKPMINIHGDSDFIVPYEGTFGLKSINDVIDYWVTLNNSQNLSTIESNDKTIKKYQYSDNNGSVYVEHYKIINGGHTWNDNVTFEGKNKSKLIWDFFSKFDLNGPIN